MSEVPDYNPLEKRSQPAMPPEPYKEKPRPQRSPLVAGLLSIIPGAGHMYIGQIATGIGFLLLSAAMVGLIIWTSTTKEFRAFNGLIEVLIGIAALFWVWVIFSAVKQASGQRFTSGLGLAIILIFTYFLGWQATEINLYKFFTEFPDTFRIFTAVMWPWNAAVTREMTIDQASAPFAVPCIEGSIPDQPQPSSDQPWVTVSPSCGDLSEYVVGEGVAPGSVITVAGGGFRAG